MAFRTIDNLKTAWLLCRIGGHLCGLPLDHVVETLRPLPIVPLADAPPTVLGVSILRGEPVVVVDLGHLLDAPVVQPERLVLLQTGPRRIGLVCEGVIGARIFGAESSRELPPLLQKAVGDIVSAVGTLDTELLLFLRTARLVPEDLFDRLDALERAS